MRRGIRTSWNQLVKYCERLQRKWTKPDSKKRVGLFLSWSRNERTIDWERNLFKLLMSLKTRLFDLLLSAALANFFDTRPIWPVNSRRNHERIARKWEGDERKKSCSSLGKWRVGSYFTPPPFFVPFTGIGGTFLHLGWKERRCGFFCHHNFLPAYRKLP